MNGDIETEVRAEVDALHAFFVGWFSGALPVGDFDESLRRVVEGGGDVVRSTPSGAESPFAVIRDPVGAHLGLVPG